MKKKSFTKPQVDSLFEAIDNPVLIIDNTGSLNFCNRAYQALAEQLSSDSLDLTDIPLKLSLEMENMLSEQREHATCRVHVGSIQFLAENNLLRINGKAVGLISVFRQEHQEDAPSRVAGKRSILSQETTAIIESFFDGIYVTDGAGNTIMVNKAYERITGIKREEVEGRNMADLVSEGFYDQSVTISVLKSRRVESMIQQIKRSGKVIMVTGNPIFDVNQNIALVVTNVRDVSALSKLQIELEKMENLRLDHTPGWHMQSGNAIVNGKYIFLSDKMKPLIDLATRLAKVDSTVLLLGESGVGKEAIADLIHSNSNRSRKLLHKISCAAIPSHLLESELFGYAAGAFTGARKAGKQGIFEVADGGTLLLDEIGELPLELQSKLLRVLESNEIRRVGDGVSRKVDVRILAATNRDLEEMVMNKQFRKDLFFRLNVVPLLIPPLRQRTDGISALTDFFLVKYNRKYGQSKTISPEAVEMLKHYSWPGNVRELKNIIERLVVTSRENLIHPRQLPDRIKEPSMKLGRRTVTDQPLKKILGDIERQVIAGTIQKHGSTRKAALVLQVDQSTVVRKAKKYNITLSTQ